MNYIEGMILGLVQGLTEFLPVSSSGHLALMRSLINNQELLDSSLGFDIAVHVGTLFAVLIYMRREVTAMVRGALVALQTVFGRRFEPGSAETTQRTLFFYVVVTTAITTVIALPLKEYVASELQHPVVVGAMLIVTGIILFASRKESPEGREMGRMRVWDTIVVGLSQGLAVIPGISRSGSTISAGLLMGLEKKCAARFSFLIAVPAISGAAIVQLPGFFRSANDSGSMIGPTLAGSAVAFISGYAAIMVLMKLVERQKLVYFAPYCWIVGATAIVLGLVYA